MFRSNNPEPRSIPGCITASFHVPAWRRFRASKELSRGWSENRGLCRSSWHPTIQRKLIDYILVHMQAIPAAGDGRATRPTNSSPAWHPVWGRTDERVWTQCWEVHLAAALSIRRGARSPPCPSPTPTLMRSPERSAKRGTDWFVAHNFAAVPANCHATARHASGSIRAVLVGQQAT